MAFAPVMMPRARNSPVLPQIRFAQRTTVTCRRWRAPCTRKCDTRMKTYGTSSQGSNTETMANRFKYVFALTLLGILAAFLIPAVPQAPEYHDFADQRAMFGVANFLNVASNVGFLLVGIAGLAVVVRPRTQFEFRSERWPYAIFFIGLLLTAVGSSYYHLAPDNTRLFWDRLPMTVAFMSLVATQLVDRISVRLGLALLIPMLLVGAASVTYWRVTEEAGVGNLVPYGVLQAYSVLILLLIAQQEPSR